jgi:hypothetical protein
MTGDYLRRYLRRRNGVPWRDSATVPHLPKKSAGSGNTCGKGHSRALQRGQHLSAGIIGDFDDNAINGIVAFRAQVLRANARLRLELSCRR